MTPHVEVVCLALYLLEGHRRSVDTEDIAVRAEHPPWDGLRVGTPCEHLGFKPPSGWVGNIELGTPAASATTPSQ